MDALSLQAISCTSLRQHLGRLISEISGTQSGLLLQRHQEDVAVVIPLKYYQNLLRHLDQLEHGIMARSDVERMDITRWQDVLERLREEVMVKPVGEANNS